jgi:hypothetical protein
MQKRAKVGGEIGRNGEFYHGGEFLPTTDMPSQHRGKGVRKPSKQEYEPYKWGFAPVEGQKSIYRQLAGTMGLYNRANDTFSIFAPYVSNLPADVQERAADLVRRYNAGERWI